MTWLPPTTKPCAKDTPKTWDEWTDVLGQTFRPGDFVAVATINGRSPQLVIAIVDKINRRNSKGEEHFLVRSYREDCDADAPGASPKRELRRDLGEYGEWVHLPGQWDRRAEELLPSCTVRCTPVMDARGFHRSIDAKPVTYSIWQNIIKVDGAIIEAATAAAAADLAALAAELS